MNKIYLFSIFVFFVFLFSDAQTQSTDDCFFCCELSDKNIDLNEWCNYSDCGTWFCTNNICVPTNPNMNTIILSKPVYRVFQFDAKFKENCKYDLTGTHWQKLMKISTLPNTDDRSIRLGWRSDNTNRIEIGLYGHVYYQMVFMSLDYFVPMETKIQDYELILSYKGLYAKALNSGYCIKRNIFDKDLWYSTGMTKNAYFEGPDEVGAPHDMRIEVSDVYFDCDADWDNMPNKGFYYSIFYDNETTTVFASNSIVAPVEPGSGANTVNKTVIIEKGANTTFISGNRIELLKGFHAKSGSHFKAIINSDKSGNDTISNLFSAIVPESEIEYKSVADTLLMNYANNNNLSVDKCNIERALQIYPNPSPGLFTLRFDDGGNTYFSVEIMDMTGNVVYRRENVQTGNTAIDIREKPKGIYFVKVLAGGEVFTEKVVVE